MPNLTTPIPPKLTGDTGRDIRAVKEWGTALVDELSYLFQNLDAGNVSEAAAVKAENIDTNNAKISNAQIGALTADKLTAGTVDTAKVSVRDNSGKMEISGSKLIIRDRGERTRFLAAYDKDTQKFQFMLCDAQGIPTVSINSSGEAVFSGTVESSAIYASTIVGTNSQNYTDQTGGVFALMDPTGIKMMQDENGVRKQKLGMSVGDNGTAYLVLGAGNGEGSHSINGVVYTNGAFKIEKAENYANMGLVGYSPFITFWEENGEIWVTGQRVMLNGIDIEAKINKIENDIAALTAKA